MHVYTHKEESHKCDDCSKYLKSKLDLKSHKNKVHSGIVNLMKMIEDIEFSNDLGKSIIDPEPRKFKGEVKRKLLSSLLFSEK